ncbi:MAG: PAS domain S-box protein [Deltaproteobacteria bacterium]|nr:PAS domain S-box protein [Deltaproteobacteria bacterium]
MSQSKESIARVAARAFGLLKEGVFELDSEFRVVFVNEYAARLAGFPDAKSLVASGLRSVDLYVDLADHEQMMERLLDGGEVDGYVCRLKDLSGRPRWIEVSGRILQDPAGQTTGYWGVLRDLTPRLEAEEARDRLHGELLDALKRLEARNRDLREFSAAVTHDLRSPLVALKGFAEILGDKYAACLGDDGMRMLERMRFNAKQMDQIIRGIQDLVLVEQEIEPCAWVDPAQVFAAVRANREQQILTAKVDVRIQEDLPRLRVHSTRLYQLLDNLLSNALRAVDGQADARVDFAYGAPCAAGVFFIEDNGPGLSEQQREKVFEAFLRIDRSRPGAGIGLTIAQRIMASYGGRIWAEPGRSGGARFCFAFGSDCQEAADDS